jgi:hypothetical protein
VAIDVTLYPRIKAAARLKVIALNLVSADAAWGIAGSVYEFDAPTLDNVSFPCVQLTSEGEREEPQPGTTEHIDWYWPVRVFLLDRDQGTNQSRRDQYKAWRRTLMEAFRDQRLSGVLEVKQTFVEPNVIYDPATLQAYQMVVGSLLLRFWTRERR